MKGPKNRQSLRNRTVSSHSHNLRKRNTLHTYIRVEKKARASNFMRNKEEKCRRTTINWSVCADIINSAYIFAWLNEKKEEKNNQITQEMCKTERGENKIKNI